MILDASLQFSNAQDISSTADSTNQLDMGVARDLGTGKALFVLVTVTTALTNTGTLGVALEGDSTSTITPDATRSLFVIPANAAIGDTFIAPLHPGGAPEQFRFLGLAYTVSGTIDAGAVDAFLVDSYQLNTLYANNYTIS